MTGRLGLVAGLVVLLLSAAPASAQTSSARSDSLEVSHRADRLLADGATARAARLYRHALEIDESNLGAYLGLSAVLDRNGAHLEALELLDDAQSLLGWTAALELQRGIHLYRLERWRESVAALARVRAQQPDSFQAAYYAGAAHLALAQWQEAVEGFSAYLASRPAGLAAGDAKVRNRRALALLELGAHRQARREVDAVLAEEPSNQTALVLRFTALAQAGDCRSALARFSEIEGLAATAPTLLYNAAVCHFRLGDARSALAQLDTYDRYATPRVGEPLLRARIYAALDQSGPAAASYREAIAAGLPAATEFATWLVAHDEPDQAVALLWPLVEQGSRDPDLLQLAVTTLQATAQWERAIIVGIRLAEVRPDAMSWRLLGDIELGRQRWAEAEIAYQQALALAPDDRVATVGLGRSRFEQASVALHAGQRESAHQLLERAHQADPSAAATTYDLALLELTDRPRRTIELLAPGLDGTADPGARLLIGRAYHAVADAPAARRAFTMVVDDRDADPRLQMLAHAYLGHLLAASDPEQALVHIGRARTLSGMAGGERLALGKAEAVAHLAVAERAYVRGQAQGLRDALAQVAGEALPAATRARLHLLEIYAHADSAGVSASLRQLATIADDDLAALGNGSLSLPALRRALALILAGPALHRPRDFTDRLRDQAVALEADSAAATLLTSWYDHRLAAALAAPNHDALARTLARSAPRATTSRSLRHNAIVAGARAQPAAKRFTAAELRGLDDLAPTVSEALVNLAIAAEGRGDHAAVLDYLERIPASQRDPAVTEWLRWKELLYGTR